jgi:lysophospholipase L1-like esterase
MSARGRFLSGLVTIVIALAGFVTFGAVPAAAAPKAVQYFALGDSYAAGTALGSYPDCQHGEGGYPVLLPPGSRIDFQDNVACSGATISDVVANQLPKLNSDTRLVTLTVGAADLHLSTVLAVCSAGTVDQCLLAIQASVGGLPTPSDFSDLYAKVAADAPRARIVVTGYPHLFESTAPVDPRIIVAVNAAIDELNATIEEAVSLANDADVNVHYVDVTEEFAGHGIGAPPLQLFIFPAGPEAFHPTPAGYDAYADAISAALPGGWFDKQKQSA